MARQDALKTWFQVCFWAARFGCESSYPKAAAVNGRLWAAEFRFLR
jgi:hypothetical protein